MIKKIVMFTTQTFKFGQTNILPIIGSVKISEKGEIEVDEDKVPLIEKLNIGFSIKKVEGVDTPNVMIGTQTTPSIDNTPEQVDITKNVVEDVNKQEVPAILTKEQIVESLKQKRMQDLVEFAKPFPKQEWESLKKIELIEYLSNKL